MAELGQAAPHCPRCQNRLRGGEKFCSACGAALDPGVPPPAQPRAAPLAHEPNGQPENAAQERRAHFEENWSELKQAGLLYGALVLSSLIVGWFGRNDTTPWSDVGGGVTEVAIVFAFVAFRYRDIVPLLGLPQARARTAMWLLFLSLAFVALLELYFYLLGKSGIQIIEITEPYRAAGWSLGVMLLINSVIPAVTEELAFRGIIQSTFERLVGIREAMLIQAALFSVVHLLPMMFPSHFLMGLMFGYLRLRTRSIYPGIALHGGWNALVVLQEIYLP